MPVDSQGRRCGIHKDVTDKPYLFFFDLTKCTRIDTPIRGCQTPQVCVASCPNDHFILEMDAVTQNIQTIRNKLICVDGFDKTKIRTIDDARREVKNNNCAAYYLPSKSCKFCVEFYKSHF